MSILVIIFTFLGLVCCGSGFHCSADIPWLQEDPSVASASTFKTTRIYQLWLNGRVYYKLSESLDQMDITEVIAAFASYHKDTCIRFVPYQEGQKQPYTTIESSNVDGWGSVCMQTDSRNFAQFGRNSKNRQTMIHELGHNLCLGHEHQRADRDKYLTVDRTCDKHHVQTEIPNYTDHGLYDFRSQMHYRCGDCLKPIINQSSSVDGCGGDTTSGLSVLDADNINQMYNCGGCFRHRWVEYKKFAKGGNEDDLVKLDTLVPCSVFYNGDILVGTYKKSEAECQVVTPERNSPTLKIKDFELLTLPGGNNNSVSTYKLVETDTFSTEKLSNAVPVGHGEDGVLYLKIITRTRYQDIFGGWCRLTGWSCGTV